MNSFFSSFISTLDHCDCVGLWTHSRKASCLSIDGHPIDPCRCHCWWTLNRYCRSIVEISIFDLLFFSSSRRFCYSCSPQSVVCWLNVHLITRNFSSVSLASHQHWMAACCSRLIVVALRYRHPFSLSPPRTRSLLLNLQSPLFLLFLFLIFYTEWIQLHALFSAWNCVKFPPT